METTRNAFDDLAARVAEHGVTAHWPEVTAVAAAATRAGAPSVVIAVLTDPTEPSVARQRAFGRALAAIAAADEPSRDLQLVA